MKDMVNRPTSESNDLLAWVYFKKGDLQKAQYHAQKALYWVIPEPIVLYHSGRIFLEVGNKEKAITLLRQALECSAELDFEIVNKIERLLQNS